MDMNVRDALADAIVNRHESAFGGQTFFHGFGQQAGASEKPRGSFGGQVGEAGVMPARDQQAMPGEERPVVQERQQSVVLEDNGGLPPALRYLAKNAIFLRRHRLSNGRRAFRGGRGTHAIMKKNTLMEEA